MSQAVLDDILSFDPADDVFVMPASFAQQRFWVIDQLDPGNSTYNTPAAYHFIGQLNVPVLEQSLNEIVRRHESLRTTFAIIDNQLMQVIKPELTLPFPMIDLSHLLEAERKSEALRLATAEVQQPFDLATGPLMRIKLFRLGPEEHIFVLVIHHIITDGWSMSVFRSELTTLYEAFNAGRPSPLPELPLQYADFAIWQRERFQGETLEKELNYWRRQLEGTLPVLTLPTDRPRPAIQTYQGDHAVFNFPIPLGKAVKSLSQREGVTLFMTLLAAFKILLYRYTGQEDIIVGSPIANRNQAEVEGIIGFFINTLVLRTDLSGAPTFRELLRRVREVALGAYAHQELPFEKILEALQPEISRSYTPLFQVLFVLQNTPPTLLKLPNLTMSRLRLENPTSKVDLSFSLREEDETIVGVVEYNTDLFDLETIEQMVGHLQTLLDAIVANPDQPINRLPLLTAKERRQLLLDWNKTGVDFPPPLPIQHLFEAQVEHTPEAVALLFPNLAITGQPSAKGAGQSLTYRELNRRANQLAHYLQTLDLGPEQRVGICLERSPEMIIALLAILKAGGAYVPLDPAYPQDRLAFMIQDAGLSVVLSHSQLSPRLAGFGLKQVCLDTDWKLIGRHSGENPTLTVTPDQLAYLIYTSGSTGKPKGVMIQHRALVNFTTAAGLEYALGPGDRILQFASINFDASAEEIYPCLTRGATLVLRPEAMIESSAVFWRCCRAWQLTVLDLPTAYWHELTLSLAAEALALPEKLRLVIIGGERAMPERLRLWQTYVGRRIRLVNTYGPTEATVVATMADLSNLEPEKLELAELPIGRPLANVQLYVLDQALQPVPAGVPGELYIGGAGLAKGYLNRPELTQEKFIPNPFKGNDEVGMMNDELSDSSFLLHHSSFIYKTGDLVRYRRDGQLEFLGRVDDQVKIRGFRIELGEIEAVLSQHPAVQEVVVLAREDKPGDKRLVAYLVPQADLDPIVADLRHFLGEKLPSYMVPAAFVILANLPLTPNGKINRQALPAPDDIDLAQQESFVAPRTKLEAQLAQVWEDVLAIRPIGIKDNFFDLGGHSLLAIRLLTQIARSTGRKLHLATLFQGPTIEQQARIMQEGSTSLLIPVQSNGAKLPFFCVPGGGDNAFIFTDLARYLGPEQPLYSFRFPERDFDQSTEDRVKDMAAKYIDEMKSLQPEGPYLLGGYCFGGIVAFEMAQQLHAQGQQVGLVAIFESYRPGAIHLSGFVPRVRHHFDKFMQLPLQEKLDYLLNRTKQRLLKIGHKLAPHLERSMHHALGEVRYYVPQPYPGRITLFHATERTPGLHYDPQMGWGGLAGEIEVYPIPGAHIDAYKEPNVQVWAQQMRVCLDKAAVKKAGDGR